MVFAGGDEGGFGGGEFGEAAVDGVLGLEMLGEADVGTVVAGFGFEEGAIEIGELAVGEAIAKQAKTFAGTGLDEAGNEQAIDGALGLLFTD